MSIKRIYFGASCLNRPFDDQWQERIRIESEAIALILERCESDEDWKHVSSDMVRMEILANPDSEKSKRVNALLPPHDDIMPITEAILLRAAAIEQMGIRAADAVHLAAAEAQQADILLTCDDQFIRKSLRWRHSLTTMLMKPVKWLNENKNENDA